MSFLISVIIFMALTFPAISQTPGYYEIIGNKDGTPIQANIGEIIEVPIWGATPVDLDSINGVCYMQDPISSDDNVIAFRYPCDQIDPNGNFLYHSFFGGRSILYYWDDRSFSLQTPDLQYPDYCYQLLLGFAWLNGDPKPPFVTFGDTMVIGVMRMETQYNPSLLGNTFDVFIEGVGWQYDYQLWGLYDGVTAVFPQTTYGQIEFPSIDELGYVAGNVTDSNGNNLSDVTVSPYYSLREDTSNVSGNYNLDYLEPGDYFLEFYHPDYGGGVSAYFEVAAQETTIVDYQFGPPCLYVAGDINHSGNLNGLDFVYLICWMFHGGPPPPLECECSPGNMLYVAADWNGSCSFNGLDFTHIVSYYRGGNPPIGCGDCPPTP